MSGMELLFGTAAIPAAEGVTASAATTGLLGYGGSFALMPALSTFGTLLTAGGMLEQGFAKSEAAKANAEGSRFAALQATDQAERDAEAISRENDSKAEVLAERQQRERGARAAALGASGIAASGSPLKVEEGASYMDTMDLATLRTTGELAVNNRLARGAQEAGRYRQQAALDDYMGNSYRIVGYAGGAGTLLSSFGRRVYG